MEAALGAVDLRRLAHRQHRRFDGERAATAHGVQKGLRTVVTGQPQDGRGERFLQRRRVPGFAITALVQRLAGGVEAQRAAPIVEVRHHHDLRVVTVHGRHGTTGSRKALANGFTHLRDDLQGRHDGVAPFGTQGFHHEATRGVEQFGPVDAARLRTQHGRRFRRHFTQHPQHAARGGQLQVSFICQTWTRAELDRTKDRLQVHRAERLELRDKCRFGFFRASGDQALQPVGRRAHRSTSKTFSTAPSAGEVI